MSLAFGEGFSSHTHKQCKPSGSGKRQGVGGEETKKTISSEKSSDPLMGLNFWKEFWVASNQRVYKTFILSEFDLRGFVSFATKY